MRKILLILALLLPAVALAQETVDEGTSFGARATVEAEAKLAKGLHLTGHEEFRWYSGDEDILRFYTGIGLEYKVLPFLKVGGEYEYINRLKHDEEDSVNEWSVRHRGNFFLTGTWKTTDWQFGLKETFRMTYRPGDMNLNQSPRTALALKHKASVKYLGWGSVVPFAAFEVRNTLNDAAYSGTHHPGATKNVDKYTDEKFLGYNHAYINRFRAQLGVTVKFDKHHEMDFYLLGDRYKDKEIDTNREGSDSWKENGLVLKSIEWRTGNLISAGVGYKWSF
jgi:opacity protein-like surface antigen